jgi:hypothetical protein
VAEIHVNKAAPTRKKKPRIFLSFHEELTTNHLCETVYHHSPAGRANGTAVITYWL